MDWEQVEDAAAAVRARCGPLPHTAVVLGSGLGDFAHGLGDAVAMPYGELPHWPVSRVVGHAGQLVVGTVAGTRVAALSGRVHMYEGHDLATVALPRASWGGWACADSCSPTPQAGSTPDGPPGRS